MGASFRYASVDSRGLSREQCVAVLGECEDRGCHTQYPLEVGVEVYR